jgi:hypothetical protein
MVKVKQKDSSSMLNVDVAHALEATPTAVMQWLNLG